MAFEVKVKEFAFVAYMELLICICSAPFSRGYQFRCDHGILVQWENAKDRSPGTVLADGKGRWTPRLVPYSPAVSSSYCGGISG